MAKASTLSLAFVSKQPIAAARVLESLEIDDAAAFVHAIPSRYAVQVVAPLNVTRAADIVERLPVDSATALLREMEFSNASAILRRLSKDQRLSILTELPDRRRRDLETVIEFSADSVGANMNTSVVTATRDETVLDAMKRVRDDKGGRSETVFIIDDQHKLVGSIRLSILARQRGKTVLANILDDDCTSVTARIPLAQIVRLPVWDQYRELPVASRKGELIGVLDRKDVVKNGLDEKAGTDSDGPSVIASILQMMVSNVPEIADLAVPARERRDNRGGSNER